MICVCVVADIGTDGLLGTEALQSSFAPPAGPTYGPIEGRR